MNARLVLPIVVLGAATASAQRATSTLDLGAIGLRYGDTISSGGISVSPALAYVFGRSSLDIHGTVSKFGTGLSGQGTLAAATLTPSWRSFSAELAGSAGGSEHEDGAKTGQVRAAARLHYMKEGAGAWLGAGAGGMWDGLAWRDVRDLEVALWASTGKTQMMVSTTPTVVDDTIEYVDTQGVIAWKVGRSDVGFNLGVRGGSRLPSTPGQSRTWGGVSLVSPMTSRASLVIAAGTYPLDFTQGFPAGQYVSAAVRFGLGKSKATASSPAVAAGITRVEVRRLSEKSIVVEVRAPSARSVELMGDITSWEAVQFQRVEAGRFSLVLPVSSSTSQVNIRLDGGRWLVPPGLTVVKDELGEEVGILVIPDR